MELHHPTVLKTGTYFVAGPKLYLFVFLSKDTPVVIRKKEERVLTGRQPWELRSCELVFASVEVLHSVAAGPPTQ